MARLVFSMMASLDGYINDAEGNFSWDQISPEVHLHANAEAMRIGTEIYGRRMYEMMVAWETLEGDAEAEREFARIWRGHDKIVVSRTLGDVASARTSLVPAISIEDMRRVKQESEKDISVSGPTLASVYLDAGLVDEIGIYLIPVVVGSGTPMFSGVKRLLHLERVEELPFANGVLFLRYRPRPT